MGLSIAAYSIHLLCGFGEPMSCTPRLILPLYFAPLRHIPVPCRQTLFQLSVRNHGRSYLGETTEPGEQYEPAVFIKVVIYPNCLHDR